MTNGGSLATVKLLEDIVREARRVPWSDWVIVEAATLSSVAEKLPAALTTDLGDAGRRGSNLLVCTIELDSLAETAKRLPLTGRVLLHRGVVYVACDQIRARLAAELRTAASSVGRVSGGR